MPTLDKIKAIKIQKNNHQRKKHNIKSTRAHNCKFKSFFAAVLIVFLLSFPLLHHLISSFLFLHMRTISFTWKSIRIKFPFKKCRLLMKTERKEDSHCCVRVKIVFSKYSKKSYMYIQSISLLARKEVWVEEAHIVT